MALPDIPVDGREAQLWAVVFGFELPDNLHWAEWQHDADDGTGTSGGPGAPVGSPTAAGNVHPANPYFIWTAPRDAEWHHFRYRHYFGSEDPGDWSEWYAVKLNQWNGSLPPIPREPLTDIALSLDDSTGQVDLIANGSPKVKSIRWAVSTSAFPASGSGTAVNTDANGDATVTNIITLTQGQTAYVTVTFYAALDGQGTVWGTLRDTETYGTGGTAVIPPSVAATAYKHSTTVGRVDVTITDPQARVSKVEFRSLDGGATAFSTWATDAAVPYTSNDVGRNCNLHPVHNSYIELGVEWDTGAGTNRLQYSFAFDVDSIPQILNVTVNPNYAAGDATVSITSDDDVDEVWTELTNGTGDTLRGTGQLVTFTIPMTSVIQNFWAYAKDQFGTESGRVAFNVPSNTNRPGAIPPDLELDTSGSTATNGNLVIRLNDPDSRVTQVRFDNQVGTGTRPGFVQDAAAPFNSADVSRDVLLTKKHTSKIFYEVYYDDVNSVGQILSGEVVFDADNEAEVLNVNVSTDPVTGDAIIDYITDDDCDQLWRRNFGGGGDVLLVDNLGTEQVTTYREDIALTGADQNYEAYAKNAAGANGRLYPFTVPASWPTSIAAPSGFVQGWIRGKGTVNLAWNALGAGSGVTTYELRRGAGRTHFAYVQTTWINLPASEVVDGELWSVRGVNFNVTPAIVGSESTLILNDPTPPDPTGIPAPTINVRRVGVGWATVDLSSVSTVSTVRIHCSDTSGFTASDANVAGTAPVYAKGGQGSVRVPFNYDPSWSTVYYKLSVQDKAHVIIGDDWEYTTANWSFSGQLITKPFIDPVLPPRWGPRLGNDLPDPGFELSATQGVYWEDDTESDIITTDPHTGSNHLRIKHTGDNSISPLDDEDPAGFLYIPVAEGDVVSYGGWIRRKSTGGSGRIDLNTYDAPYGTFVSTVFTAGVSTDAWTRVAATYTVPSGVGAVRVRARTTGDTSTNDGVYFDDLFCRITKRADEVIGSDGYLVEDKTQHFDGGGDVKASATVNVPDNATFDVVGGVNNYITKVKTVPPHAVFEVTTVSSIFEIVEGASFDYLGLNVATLGLHEAWAQIELPPGVTVSQLKMRYWSNDETQSQVHVDLYKQTSSARTLMASCDDAGTSSASWRTSTDSSISSGLLSDGDALFLKIGLSSGSLNKNNARLREIEVEYRMPEYKFAV